MANERIPNDTYRPAGEPYRSADDPYRSARADDTLRNAARLDNELQVDPELAEGPAGSGRIIAFAVGIALVLGAVFYGLNNSTINNAGTSPAASTAQNTPASPPAAPPGVRDVTPRANTAPGMTTGAAPARQTPPASTPTGTDVNRSGNPPASDSSKK